MRKRLAPFAASSLFFGGIALAAGSAAASNKVVVGLGHDLAQHTCSGCHLIEPGQVNPPDHVGGPSFQSVANRPTTTVEFLRRHLRTTQSNAVIPLAMPNPKLSDDEIVKIIAYITSLRAPADPAGH